VDFIFMLTRDDQTVIDCLEVVYMLDESRPSHLGFKDVGVDRATLARLQRRIKDAGATSYLEVVSTGRVRALESARMAIDLGVDWLMGGTWVDETLRLLEGTHLRYLPFPGAPAGHPTRLRGSPAQIAKDCRRFEEAGCAGVDLLAYRATDAAPIDLVRSARSAISGRLVVAGSISNTCQIHELAKAGADAFTVGSAAMTGSFAPRMGTLRQQLISIMQAARDCSETPQRTVSGRGNHLCARRINSPADEAQHVAPAVVQAFQQVTAGSIRYRRWRFTSGLGIPACRGFTRDARSMLCGLSRLPTGQSLPITFRVKASRSFACQADRCGHLPTWVIWVAYRGSGNS
jgi:hypothetical protein